MASPGSEGRPSGAPGSGWGSGSGSNGPADAGARAAEGPAATAETATETVAAKPSARAADAGRRSAKFRQAAFVYLHVGLLYEFGVLVFWRQGLLPENRGPAWLWLAIGAGIVAVIFWALWRWQKPWVARTVWALHALRLPALIQGAFFPDAASGIPPAFFLTALVVVLVNLWMLARAGWDL